MSSDEYRGIDDLSLIRYKCGKCGADIPASDIEYMPAIKCPYCGYRVLYKVRPVSRRLIKAI